MQIPATVAVPNMVGLTASQTATGCSGVSTGSGVGLSAFTAENCYGQSSSGDGLDTTVANNCYGQSGGSGTGLNAVKSATGCTGISDSYIGLYAGIANDCTGVSRTLRG